MKTLIRGNAKTLQQIIKRISEIQMSDNETVHNSLYKLRKTHNNGPLTSNLNFLKQYKHLDIGTIHLSTHSPNNAIILKDKRIGLVKNFLDNRGSPLLIVQFYQNVQDLYDIPISSSVLDIYSVSELSCDLFEVDIDLLETKLYLMPGFSDSEMAAFPISKFFHAEDFFLKKMSQGKQSSRNKKIADDPNFYYGSFSENEGIVLKPLPRTPIGLQKGKQTGNGHLI